MSEGRIFPEMHSSDCTKENALSPRVNGQPGIVKSSNELQPLPAMHMQLHAEWPLINI